MISNIFVHPSAICESREIGEGTRLWAFSHVLDGAVIGRDCNICDHAYVEGGARIGDRVTVKNHVMIWDGVTIEDDVFLGPGMMFTNDLYPRCSRMPEVSRRYRRRENWLAPTLVRRGASIGAGSVILAGVTIGMYAGVGAGAVVTRDVGDHRLVMGNPARVVGWVCVCGAPLDDREACPKCHRRLPTARVPCGTDFPVCHPCGTDFPVCHLTDSKVGPTSKVDPTDVQVEQGDVQR